MLQRSLPCTHTHLQNMNYRKENLKAFPPCLPVVLVQRFRLLGYMCTHSGHAFLEGRHTTSLLSHLEEASETPHRCSAARALQDQIPFHSLTDRVASLLSIPCWILGWAGSCSGNMKQALAGALLSLQGLWPLEAHPGLVETGQVCSSCSSGSRRHTAA